MSQWILLAQSLRSQQLNKVLGATRRVLSTMSEIDVPVIGAGVGRFLALDVATQCGLKYRELGEISRDDARALNPRYIADYAPAVAVASLLHSKLENIDDLQRLS
jgi:uncharacterized hydantoinase/oxoprolinase family protein